MDVEGGVGLSEQRHEERQGAMHVEMWGKGFHARF